MEIGLRCHIGKYLMINFIVKSTRSQYLMPKFNEGRIRYIKANHLSWAKFRGSKLVDSSCPRNQKNNKS